MSMENPEENNILQTSEKTETNNFDLEKQLEILTTSEDNKPIEKKEHLGASTLELLTPQIEIDTAIENKKANRNVGSIRDVVKECQRVELLLGVKTKGLYTKSRTEVEIILDQRKAQLLELNRPKIIQPTKEEPQRNEVSTDDIFSQVKQPESQVQTPSTQNEEPQVDQIIPNKKPPVVHKKKAAKQHVAEDPLDKANADMLFRMNLLFLFSVETISEKYADQLNTSFTGVTKKMSSDYDRDDYLKGVYKRVYQENKELITQYASPLSELALYNCSVLGTYACTNLDKNIKKNV